MDKTVIIFSTIKLYNGNSAGSARMMNYAKALSKFSNVYLFSFTESSDVTIRTTKERLPNIFTVGKERSYKNKLIKRLTKHLLLIKFIWDIIKYFRKSPNCVFLLYPSTEAVFDIYSLVLIKFIYNRKTFLEANEVRKYAHFFESDYSFLKNPIKYLKLKKLFYQYSFNEKLTRFFDGLICISTNIEKYYRKFNHNTIRIPILIDPKEFNLTRLDRFKLFEKKTETFRIGFTGSISVIKENFITLFDVLKIISNSYKIKLDMYGPITDREKNNVEVALKKRNLLSVVSIKGKVSQKKIPGILQNFHLLILPRGNHPQNKYGFSTKLSEYLASGTPVLVTSVSDNALYIKDSFNGFIIPPDDEKALQDKLIYIIENYNYLSSKIVLNSVRTVNENFNYNIYSNQIIQFLC